MYHIEIKLGFILLQQPNSLNLFFYIFYVCCFLFFYVSHVENPFLYYKNVLVLKLNVVTESSDLECPQPTSPSISIPIISKCGYRWQLVDLHV